MTKALLLRFLFLLTCFSPTAFLLAKPGKQKADAPKPAMRITEFIYDGANKEWVEFTNLGDTAIDMTGWSYDDDSRKPGTVSLSAFGKVQPGESVILAEASAADFRAAWKLCDNVKVIGNNSTNLGRADEINLFSNTNDTIDRITFGDNVYPGTIRTQNKSGVVTAAGVGANDISKWVLSAIGDAESSYASIGGDIGSPGKSAQSPVRYNACAAPVRITEFMYDGGDKEWVEFTNVGDSVVDMTGWSYDDDSRVAGTVSLSAFGKVQPGESVILSEASAADFRAAWGLCDKAKVIGSNSTNLGRADEINLFDASGAWVDRITYGDQTYTGTIRTQNKSGVVSAAGLGKNDITQWALSATGDAEGSVKSAKGDIGSPGTSTRATVKYNPCVPGAMRITEFMYDGSDKEWVEFTNIGTSAVDMTGWSYDDDSRVAGTVSLSAFGKVQPGESVILAENTTDGFRTAWGLCSGVKIIGSNGTNLGRADEINLFNNTGDSVDRITFGDQAFPGTIRTQNKSGYVTAAGLGKNDISKWVLSAVGDSEGSFTSKGGDVGSPGKSTQAVVAYTPCIASGNGPSIAINTDSTTNYLDRGDTSSPASPYAISGVINDPVDPAFTKGIYFTVTDSTVAATALTVTATSSNTTVVTNANLVLSGVDSVRKLTIKPTGVGYADITVTVSNGTSSTSYILNYAASSTSSPDIKWATGIADASAAIALDSNYMVIANDEDNHLYVFNRNASGLPAKTYDFNAGNYLSLTDGSTDNWKEVDVEAGTSSAAHAGRTYWLGSMSNSSSFNDKPNRDRIFAVDIKGTGDTTKFTNAGYYAGLRNKLITWGDTHGYAFSTSAAEGKDPKAKDGFNLEGMVFAPDNTTLYLGFRAPLVPTANRTKAVIAPVQSFESWFNNGTPAGAPTIGNPIELDLAGRGIRDLIRLGNGKYVIVAGSAGEERIPAIYLWSGNPAEPPVITTAFNIDGLNIEGVMQVNENGQMADDKLQVICDNGDSAYYKDGTAAKDLAMPNFKKFISLVVTSSKGGVLPAGFTSFTAQRNNTVVNLNWQFATPANVASYNVMRSFNGIDFTLLQTVKASATQTAYNYTDAKAPMITMYYRIQANETSAKVTTSPIRVVTADGGAVIKVYPNPVTTSFIINANTAGNKTVSIYNAGGAMQQQLSFGETTKTVSTANWPKGVYLVRIVTSDNNVVTQKIVVQ